jgi:hypothetical protein
MHGDEIAIEDAGILHGHADHLEQVVRTRLEDRRIDVQAGFDVLFGENRTAGGDAADERQAHLFADGVLQLDAARGAGNERDDPFARERAQVLFGSVGRAKTELAGDLGACGRHARFVDEALDETQDLGLAWCQVGHGLGPRLNCLFVQLL